LQDVEGPLASIIPFTMLFYGVHYPIYYQHGQHEEEVINIESSLCMKEGDPLGGLLFALTHYQTLLKTIVQAPNCVLPSLTNDTHIMGFMNKIIPAFDHLSTQLALIGLKVKVLNCKLWSSSKIYLGIEIPQNYTLVTNGLRILGVPMGSQNFLMHFLDETLSQKVVHIDGLPFLKDS